MPDPYHKQQNKMLLSQETHSAKKNQEKYI